ncbi:MAG TPA: hypothetical protein VG370_11655 [Chloroflexota bacterium]|nr:hypothetical protein [Chloroflexota bacterium]
MPGPRPGGRRHLPVYLGGALLFAATALPFALADADGFRAGLDGVPSPGVWDSLGRALAIVREGPLPDGLGRGPGSPLWTWLLALGALATGWSGLPLATLAKLLGLAAGMTGAFALYGLALRATGSRWPGVVVLALIGLDPSLAYGRLSGSEAPLAFALTALAVLALVWGHRRPLAWLLALVALVRPDGALVAAAVGALLAAAWLRRALRAEPCAPAPAARGEAVVVGLAELLAPAAAAAALWSLHGLTVGEPSASPLGAIGRWPTLASLGAVWGGWLATHPLFGSYFVVLTLATWGWTAARLARQWGPVGLAPVVVPLVPLLSLMTAGELPAAGWNYDVRRIGEPALPWLAFSLALGLTAAGDVIWRSVHGAPARLRRWPLGRAVAVLPLLWALPTAIELWPRLPTDFAFGARNVAEAPLALGRWIAADAPPSARIALAPGAEPVRGSARRPVGELPRPGGADPAADRELLRERGIDYLVAYRGSPEATWPQAREIARSASARNVALPAPEIALFRLQWDLPKLEASQPQALRLQGYAVVDRLDVGDGASETAHFYASAGPAEPVRAESAVLAGWIADEGRRHEVGRGGESFTLVARPGRDLLLAVRYDGASRGSLRVEVERSGYELQLRGCGLALCEGVLLVPAEQVRRPTVPLAVTFAGAPGARVATYHYWAIAPG